MKALIIIAAIVAAFAAAIWYFFRKFSGLTHPPLRVHLVRDDAGRSLSRRAMEEYRRYLDGDGFEEIGQYRVQEIPGMVLAAFAQKYLSVCAVVYTHPLVGCFLDMHSENEEGRSLTVSNAPTGDELDQPPGRRKIVDKTLTAVEMYDLILRERPAPPHKQFDASNFVDEFEAAYAKEMDWRMSRDGATKEEIRRAAAAVVDPGKGKKRATEKMQAHYAARDHEH